MRDEEELKKEEDTQVRCRRCNRVLWGKKSVEEGIGKGCKRREFWAKHKPLTHFYNKNEKSEGN